MSLIFKHPLKTRRGDTLIEVTFAITIFCLISILTIGLMDSDLSAIQGTLELNMARNEVDAQAEALRFIHNSYLAEREYTTAEGKEYQALWRALTENLSNSPSSISTFEETQCSVYYDEAQTTSGRPHNIFIDKAFIINTRNIDPTSPNSTIIRSSASVFSETSLYPRVIFSPAGSSDQTSDEMSESTTVAYDQVARAEGIWVIAANDATTNSTPQFYDFHIRTCWYAPGRNVPTTIATIVRLYNPDYREGS